MDTDSAYIAFSGEQPFPDLIKPELREHFEENKHKWFPRDDTSEHAKYDKRTPGLFKEEWRGGAMVSLSSKNYICYDGDLIKANWLNKKTGQVEPLYHKTKCSAKGVQKSNNAGILTPEKFESVINEKITLQATNRGFRVVRQTDFFDNQRITNTPQMQTYEQQKNGCGFFYDKRILYNEPKTGFISAQKLYLKARVLDSSVTLKKVRDWLSTQSTVQRFQDQKPAFQLFKIASSNPNSWQADLTFWPELGKQPIFTAINVNSRLGYAKILANKQASTMLTAIKAFVKACKPSVLTTDNGTEFLNSTVQAYFKQQKIEHFNNEAGDHAKMGKIERFNRTIKQRLMQIERKLTPKLLGDIIHNYNRTENSAIGQKHPKKRKVA
ncbi:unnamed protein product [Phytophthora lilii]|uniref:Unnamed protein product n=1 Tax=Phytophthora lilii TaxID=2077276 RepID=A0A9W6YLL4_9STRA|nr:unnamed protein product [Phytophthora lilii]